MKLKQFPTKLGVLLFAVLLTISLSISCENIDYAKPEPVSETDDDDN